MFIVNRTLVKAEILARSLGPRAAALPWAHLTGALREATAVINATSAGLDPDTDLDLPLEATGDDCVVMDMVYKPLETALLKHARALGRPTVDGLEMLIRQAEPSFEAFFGQLPPVDTDVRGLAVAALEETRA